MLRGIDISSWQENIDLAPLPISFVIVKATEGTDYVNPYCDPKIQQAKSLDLKWGFYHFAGTMGAIAEADYFVDNCSGYFGQGIPVLDWEGEQDVAWVNAFVARVRERTGVNCWIYGNPWRFNQGGVDQNCARWVASYPDVKAPSYDWNPGEPPYTDGLIACWQFASDGQVPGYSGNLDVNEFYGDRATWDAYAGVAPTPQPEPAPEPAPEAGASVLENSEYRVTIEPK